MLDLTQPQPPDPSQHPLLAGDPGLLSQLTMPPAPHTPEPEVPQMPQMGSQNDSLIAQNLNLLRQMAGLKVQSRSGSVNSGLASSGGYVNPLGAISGLVANRIDQGVDYSGSGHLRALGPGVVVRVNPNDPGWPGGGYVAYRITAGPDAGKVVFNAENLTPNPHLRVGSRVRAGQPIGFLHGGMETGLADSSGSRPLAQLHGGYSEGDLTAAGLKFARLLASLGAPMGKREGRPVRGY